MRRLIFASLFVFACVPLHRDDGARIQRMCLDPNAAYEAGHNQGLQRGRLDTTWVDSHCAPERANSIRTAYHEGYNAGIANAPIMVKQTHSHSVSSTSESCRFSSDCGEGQTCRSNQCMGNGWRGDACWFSSDCNSNNCDGSTRTCR
jgi:hypothetical protein